MGCQNYNPTPGATYPNYQYDGNQVFEDGFITLPGLSKQVYNLTAYYENSGFEARISQRKRSDFIGEIGNFNGTGQMEVFTTSPIRAGSNAIEGYRSTKSHLRVISLIW